MAKITISRLRKAMQKCVFDPREPGPMSLILDVDNPEYWERRAIEQLNEIHKFNADPEEKLICAISLLLASLVKREP